MSGYTIRIGMKPLRRSIFSRETESIRGRMSEHRCSCCMRRMIAVPQGAEYQKQINQQIYTATQGGTYIIHASDIRFEGSAGTITLSEIIGMKERIQKLEEGGS